MTGRSGISVSLYQEASRRQTASCCGSGTSLSEKTSRRPCSRRLRLRQYSMGLAGDVLVFIADCEPICALQARVEILQAAAIESRARDGHFRFILQVTSTSSLYEDTQHRASSGPLRLLRWSRGDRAGLKADVQIWVTFPKEFDEIVAKLHFIVLVQCSPSLPRNNQITSVSRLKTPSCWTTPLLRCTVQPKLLSLAFDMQADLPNSSHFELVPGGLRMLKKFLGTVSSWTKQV